MLYSYIVKKRIRQTFDDVNNHRWVEVVKPVAPNVHHRFSGAHALAGERHDKEALRRWFERLGRVLPNLHIKVNNIWVRVGRGIPPCLPSGTALQRCSTGTLRTSTVVSTCSPCGGARVYALEEFEDSQAAARGLAAQAAAGLEEAVAEQIIS